VDNTTENNNSLEKSITEDNIKISEIRMDIDFRYEIGEVVAFRDLDIYKNTKGKFESKFNGFERVVITKRYCGLKMIGDKGPPTLPI
jgi:hypothetical protein